MRIISLKTLREFWEKPEHKDAEGHLKSWYKVINEKNWNHPNDIIGNFRNADQVGNGIIVFNICHNKYRLIVKFRYDKQIGYIRFIGTHKLYDKIRDIKNI